MEKKKTYRVLITETRQKTVLVEARSEAEAHARAEDAWRNTEYIIDAGCFQGAEFHVLGESDADEQEKDAERIDGKDG